MTSEQEKRVQAIEAQWEAYNDPDVHEYDALDDIAYFDDMRDDIKWLIALAREAEAPIPHCKISKLHPGDTIVFKYPGKLNEHAVENMKKIAAAVFGSEYRVVVLEEGLDLEIVRPKSTAESEADSHLRDPEQGII